MDKETREAIAASGAGYWIGYVHGDRASEIINDASGGISKAIDAAITVEITKEVIQAYLDEAGGCSCVGKCLEQNLRAAFRAAGFVVKE